MTWVHTKWMLFYFMFKTFSFPTLSNCKWQNFRKPYGVSKSAKHTFLMLLNLLRLGDKANISMWSCSESELKVEVNGFEECVLERNFSTTFIVSTVYKMVTEMVMIEHFPLGHLGVWWEMRCHLFLNSDAAVRQQGSRGIREWTTKQQA